METSEISIHQCRLFHALKTDGGWITSKEAAIKADIAKRTARAHLLRFVQQGLLDQAEVFPAHRYRLAAKADKRNLAMLQRLESACVVFGLTTLEKNKARTPITASTSAPRSTTSE